MKIVDLNVLLYAINENSPQHATALNWWTNALRGDETVGLAWTVLCGFLRLTTHSRVFPRPLTVQQATQRVDAWLSLPIVAIPTEKPDHWETLRGLLAEAGTAGNLVTDAHLAALALTRDATVVSFDHDFARFDGLRVERPRAA